MLEASPEASKTRSLCFVDKARSVLDLRARVVLAPLERGALERASEAVNLVASPLFPHPTLFFYFRLSFPGLVGLGD